MNIQMELPVGDVIRALLHQIIILRRIVAFLVFGYLILGLLWLGSITGWQSPFLP